MVSSINSAAQPSITGAHDVLASIGPVLVLFGSLGLLHAVRVRRRAVAAACWPTTTGTITSAHIKKGKSWSDMSHSGKDSGATVYRARIAYSYVVDGVHLEGTRAQFGLPKRDQVKANVARTVEHYAVGQAIPVHYDPERPAESVLETGLPPFWRRSWLFSAGTLALGLAACVAALAIR